VADPIKGLGHLAMDVTASAVTSVIYDACTRGAYSWGLHLGVENEEHVYTAQAQTHSGKADSNGWMDGMGWYMAAPLHSAGVKESCSESLHLFSTVAWKDENEVGGLE
jgi:hypothetical protein